MKPTPAPRFGPDTPPPASPVEVEPGIHWLHFPLPFALDHVNLWLLDDPAGWIVIDTGFGNRTCQAIWEELLEGPLATRPLVRIVVTHFHPDHMGLAGWLQQRTGAALWMPTTEWLMARMLWLDDPQTALARSLAFYRLAGLDEGVVEAMRADGHVYARRITAPPTTHTPIFHGQELVMGGRTWRVITGGGHAQDQACFFSATDGLLLSADQVLPRISPNVAIWPQAPEADPLGRFLSSLGGFFDLPEDTRTLPSHDWPFTDLHGRVQSLIDHHRHRLDQTLEAVATGASAGASAAAIFRVLFPKIQDLHQTRFALGEALAHLNHLVAAGRLERRLEDGVWRFVPAD
jgi:glyoxylase-like metal-dependent hydrolase (beta-lactamase superfamily II)